MTITPDQARELLDGTTPGPWEWNGNCDKRLDVRGYDSLGNDTQHALETQDFEDYSSWVVASDEDKAIIAAAPDLAQTVIDQGAQIERLQKALHKADKWGNCLEMLIEDGLIEPEDVETPDD